MPAFFNALSPMHLLVIGLVALIFFGNRLPEVARSLGRSFNEFKRGLREVQDELSDDDDADDESRKKFNSPTDQERVAREARRETEKSGSKDQD